MTGQYYIGPSHSRLGYSGPINALFCEVEFFVCQAALLVCIGTAACPHAFLACCEPIRTASTKARGETMTRILDRVKVPKLCARIANFLLRIQAANALVSRCSRTCILALSVSGKIIVVSSATSIGKLPTFMGIHVEVPSGFSCSTGSRN